MLVSRIAATVGFVQYGCLCFLCFKLRKAFTNRFRYLAEGLENQRENEGKSKICEAYLEYKDFRDFVGYWMTFALSNGMVGMASLISWNYGYFKVTTERHMDHEMFMYSIMIWNQKLMFIIQPLIVFNGVNVDYLWDDFKEYITEHLMAPKTAGQKFHRFMRHMNELNHSPQWIISTLILGIVGLYFGMHLSEQNFQYWIGPDCYNVTMTDNKLP